MPRILPFIGTASVQFHTIIVSRFMQNGNILDYFKWNPGADRQCLVIQTAEAVHWLHGHMNLVHGDIKGENVLVNDEGDAMLADFGLATLIEHEASSVTTVSSIRRMNTLPFAAPELLFSPEDRDGGYEESDEGYRARPRSKTWQSDVYAFGMLILQASHPPRLPLVQACLLTD
ncbi:kinase-like protein [Auricularia subglabra TFB-10046 SS5]|nr:kinase-like protein [Auricularia subglabra TFB-10046 SS5]